MTIFPPYYIKALDSAQLILYCVLIFYLSHQPTLATPMLFMHQDKVMHAGAYFIMTALALRTFRHFLGSYTALLLAGLLFSSLYGISDEWHQSFVPGRDSSIYDWLADTFGAAVCIGVYARLRAYLNRKNV